MSLENFFFAHLDHFLHFKFQCAWNFLANVFFVRFFFLLSRNSLSFLGMKVLDF